MERNVIIAVVLSAVVIFAFQYFMPQPPPAAPPAPLETAQKEQPPETPVKPAAAPAQIKDMSAAEEKEISVETDLYIATLSTRGGSITSWQLKGYRDQKKEPVFLLKKTGAVAALGAGANQNFDLSLVNFAVKGSDLKLSSASPTGTLVFAYAKEGKSLTRTYTFSHDSYKVDVVDETSGLPEYWVTLGSGFGIFETDDSTHTGPTVLTGTDLKQLKPKNLKDPALFQKDLKWIAQEDKYFFAGLVPLSPVEEARAWLSGDSPVIAFKAKDGAHKFALYAGPKEHDGLAKLGLGLEHIIDFGFFSIIARPIFWLLKFFHKYIGNWGWAIVLITIVTRIPFIPLVNKSQQSMKKLQDIQPKMNEIREKFKKDPQRMQQELTGLYKKHKVNPLGGCLPILIQIPVFFALYKVLLVSIELRGAPFALWIADLSMKDPYYILPVVMGVTMLIQQKMTPSTMDPQQAKIMLLMPVVFTFMFLNFASGLVLYWLVNNIFGIAQQFYTNSQLKKQASPA